MTDFIDLDLVSGQVIQVGNTTTGAGQVQISNTSDGQVIASLDQILNFGGSTTKTSSSGVLTIDIYGRVLGFATPDDFYFSVQTFTATSGQTVFTPTTRNANYITGQDLILQNGILLSTSDYTETSTTFTLNVGATVGDQLTCMSMRAIASQDEYAYANIVVQSIAGAVVTYDVVLNPFQAIIAGQSMTFINTGTPTIYTVSSVNYTTREITFTASVTGVSTGASIYYYRAITSSYPTFTRYEVNLTTTGSYTPTTWSINNGYEFAFINGVALPDPDYNIVSGAITAFPANVTGTLTIIQFNVNNLGTCVSYQANVVTYTDTGVADYIFSYGTNAFNLYANGTYMIPSSDYTPLTTHYTFTITPNNNTTVLQQQTFSRTGAA
jgi:hypothetical protein